MASSRRKQDSDNWAHRDRLLAVMVTQRELEIIQQIAYREGLTASTWVRRVLLPLVDAYDYDITWVDPRLYPPPSAKG